ncbi:tigger transposable element-derived protein 6-like [Rhizophagus clarus]|uniref:Tigger transposable element-derived protein 6-like n=2 Tax=Rhizophagus clarus TaxID=94130 RepID=A0A8H3L9H6_9GLOM|nr:tigger transposable element-derived protein 6-like [Rhizophagus clarus]
MPPNQTLSTKPILGQTKDKTRIMILLTNPNPDSDNIDNDGSTGAGRCDNNASGREVTQLNLTHIEVAFLPPNTTSHLQLLDAGVIKSFKAHYKQNYCRHILKLFEEEKDINKEKQAILNEDVADTNQIIEDLDAESDDPLADSLANALNDFCDLDEEIPTEDVLNENDIIKLIQEEMNEENDNSDDSEDEPVLVSLDDTTKSLQTYITFFEQQEIDEFKNEDGYGFKNGDCIEVYNYSHPSIQSPLRSVMDLVTIKSEFNENNVDIRSNKNVNNGLNKNVDDEFNENIDDGFNENLNVGFNKNVNNGFNENVNDRSNKNIDNGFNETDSEIKNRGINMNIKDNEVDNYSNNDEKFQ